MPAPDVTVVGAGVIGVMTALELADRGASVTILERGPTAAAGCSAGNAGIVGSSDVLPLASREAVREGLHWMVRRHGALSLSPRPATLPWIARFLMAANASRYRRAAEVLGALAGESAQLHRALGERFETGYAERGFLSVYESPANLARAAAHAAPGSQRLDGAAARDACPQLAVKPAGAIFTAQDAHCDPERFVRAVASEAADRGVRLRTGVEVLSLRRRGGRVTGLSTTACEWPVGELVLAAGAWTPPLARVLPVRVPIQGGKGYHVDYEPAPTDTSMPVYFAERRVIATPMGERLRVAGMLQLAGTDMRVDEGRVETIAEHARQLLHGLAARPVRRVWRGLRPCTPDGVPIIGRVPGIDNVTLATGHGMWGLQLAPVTARIVADVLTGRPDVARLAPLRPERFAWLNGRSARHPE